MQYALRATLRAKRLQEYRFSYSSGAPPGRLSLYIDEVFIEGVFVLSFSLFARSHMTSARSSFASAGLVCSLFDGREVAFMEDCLRNWDDDGFCCAADGGLRVYGKKTVLYLCRTNPCLQ